MKKNIFLVALIIFLCCGCTTEYTIEIDENLGVKEKAVALEDEEFFKEYPNSSVERVIGFLLNPNLEYLNENGFDISNISQEESAGVSLNNSYKSISEYIEKSEIYKQYGDLEYTENKDTITLRIKGMLSNNDQDQSGKYLIDYSEINIKLPHTVKEHNADKVDKDNGLYTWYIDESGAEKELYITFDKKVKKQIHPEFIVVVIMFVIVLAISYSLWSKLVGNKNKRNEV